MIGGTADKNRARLYCTTIPSARRVLLLLLLGILCMDQAAHRQQAGANEARPSAFWNGTMARGHPSTWPEVLSSMNGFPFPHLLACRSVSGLVTCVHGAQQNTMILIANASVRASVQQYLPRVSQRPHVHGARRRHMQVGFFVAVKRCSAHGLGRRKKDKGCGGSSR